MPKPLPPPKHPHPHPHPHPHTYTYTSTGMLPKAIVDQLKQGKQVSAESFDCVTIYFR